jgi:isoquinoline 1-oxidoreductase alpha subunit
MAITVTVNGTAHTLDVEPDMPVLWLLREQLNLTGTKYGCGIAACGACTVHLDGRAVRSCVLPASAADGKTITTIEALGTEGALHPVQQAWIAHQVPQCGYCQSGMIMAVAGLLAQTPTPTEADIDARLTNVCRCGTFTRIRTAIHATLQAMAAPATTAAASSVSAAAAPAATEATR